MTGTGKVTIETLHGLVDAFNAHDLDAVMSYFADDGSARSIVEVVAQALGASVRWATACGAVLTGNDTTATGQPTSRSRVVPYP